MTNPDLVFTPADCGRGGFEENLRLWRPVEGSRITPPKFTVRFGQL